MSRCIIIAAHCAQSVSELIQVRFDDFVICADGGYRYAQAAGIRPDLVMGDFDSFDGKVEEGVEVIRVPIEKDDTDTMLCLKHGMECGYDEFIIVGATGGRLDHTLANLQTLAYGCSKGCFVLLADEDNLVTMIGADTVRVPRLEGYKLSVLAYTDVCTGVYESGVQYPLHDATITNLCPLGISNEFLEEAATITCGRGQLLILLSRDHPA